MDGLVVERGERGGGGEVRLTIEGVAMEIGDDPIAGALFNHSECEERRGEREREGESERERERERWGREREKIT